MPKFKLYKRNGGLLVEGSAETFIKFLENSYADLRSANLRSANLRSASLRSANLSSADLRSANLSYADLRSANLSYASLGYASLRSADLRSASLRSADLRSANLRSANLSYASLGYASLRSADLRSANLSSANLRSADLRSASLRSADLRSASLRSANLSFARGINKLRTSPLYMLFDQTGKIRAYKLVNKDYQGKTFGGITFKAGECYTEYDCDYDEREDCGAGINLATLDWCLAKYEEGDHILIAEFSRKHEGVDNICVPIATDGKFRVRHCKIIREKSLKELGIDEGGK
jgi:hypothetical protein